MTSLDKIVESIEQEILDIFPNDKRLDRARIKLLIGVALETAYREGEDVGYTNGYRAGQKDAWNLINNTSGARGYRSVEIIDGIKLYARKQGIG